MLSSGIGKRWERNKNINGYVPTGSLTHQGSGDSSLLYALYEHKLGNGEALKHLAMLYAHSVLEETGADMVPIHTHLVSRGFPHPVLALAIEEQTLKVEALHLGGSQGIVSEALACCNLRFDLSGSNATQCAVLLSAIGRCLTALDSLYAYVASGECEPSVCIVPITSSGTHAIPDLSNLKLPSWAANGVYAQLIQARIGSFVFRCVPRVLPVGFSTTDEPMAVMVKVTAGVIDFKKRSAIWEVIDELELAPKRVSEESYGVWAVVVTEWLDAPWATLQEVLSRTGNTALTESERSSLHEAVSGAVERMVSRGIVHGDLHRGNIMVRKVNHAEPSSSAMTGTGANGEPGGASWQVKFVDWDWAGKEGEARYSRTLNTAVPRPVSAKPGAFIRAVDELRQIDVEFEVA